MEEAVYRTSQLQAWILRPLLISAVLLGVLSHDPLAVGEAGRGGGMTMDPSGAFKSQQAPCGKIVDGKRYEDRDEEVMITEQQYYACGCLVTRHEYHDGSVSSKVVHHNGKILVDELFAAH